MIIDILLAYCNKTGLHPVNDRITALFDINRAAKEIYDGLEPDRGLSEVVLSVPKDKQLSLPYYIGELRGIREYKYSTPIPLYSIGQPQYSSSTWQFLWRNWRQKPVSPIHTSLDNGGILSLNQPTADSSVVSVAMQTVNGNRIVENITMDATIKNTTNSPSKIYSISSATQGRLYDCVVKDIVGVEIATLFNNQQKTRYLTIDVSEFQWGSSFTNDGVTTLAECLFKPALIKMYYDTDEFICEGYDDAVYCKAMEIWYHGQEGKENDAIAFGMKATRVTDLATRSQEQGEMKTVQFQPNGVYNAFKKIKQKGWWNNGGVYSGSNGSAFVG